ncbi:MAG TPA: serine hydrolase domain-containing protein [Candidatus Baltobacteraceae bacterium]|nr:serine hydrolase domain-containing protein [Candidatus Baltobacteraceae bacterium]
MMHALLAGLLLSSASPDYPALLKALHIPGAQVAVVKNGALVSNDMYGVKNLKNGTPVDAHTRFEIGSITKQFTAAAILQLRASGKLSLDDKLGKYVPEYKAGRNITLRQMLLQISGIPNYTDTKAFGTLIAQRNGSVTIGRPGNLQSVIAMIRQQKLDFAPGTKWEYSNSNYYLLGHVVEVASGMPWASYVESRIFKPAGMSESSFMENEAHVSDMATGYTIAKKGGLVPTGSFDGWAGGAGTIVSTSSDLAKWDLALLGGKIVSAEDRKLMMTGGPVPSGQNERYGFGWVIDTYDGQPRTWHNGGTLGFTASNQIYPGENEIVIVLANSTAGNADTIADQTFDGLHPDLAASKTKAVAGEDAAVTKRIQTEWTQLTSGTIDRTQFTAEANKAFTPDLLASAKAAFAPLGAPKSWVYRGKREVRGLTVYTYYVTFESGTSLNVTMTVDAEGKIAGYNAQPG